MVHGIGAYLFRVKMTLASQQTCATSLYKPGPNVSGQNVVHNVSHHDCEGSRLD